MAWTRWSYAERRALYRLRTIYGVSLPMCARIINRAYGNDRTTSACSGQMGIIFSLSQDDKALKLGFEPDFFKANEKLASNELFGVFEDGWGNYTIKR